LLNNQNNWRENTDKIIRLQSQWKELGPVNYKEEEILWKKFRTICDTFFNAKKEHYATLDIQQAENLKKKEELVLKIEKTQLTGDLIADKEIIKAFSDEWNNISFVPLKNKKEIEKRYTAAIEEKYSKMNISGEEKEKMIFKNKVEHLKQIDTTGGLLDKERRFITEKIKKIEAEANQYENNFGFITGSKGGTNSLKIEIESKINNLKSEIDKLKDQLKLISSKNGLKKLQE